MTTPSAATRYDNDLALASLKQPEDFIMVDLALVDALDGDHLAAILFARIAFRSRRRPWRATYEDLAAETRLSRNTMQRRLASLRDAGLITAEPAGGFDQAMVYDVPGRTRNRQTEPAPSVQDGPVDRSNLDRPSSQSGAMEEPNLDRSSLLIEGKKKSENRSGPGPRPLPPDWTPNDGHRERAAKHGQDVEELASEFRDYYLMKGKKFSSWDAAFNNWLRKDREFHPPKRSTWSAAKEPSQLASAPRPSESLDEYNARIDRQMAEREAATAARRESMQRALAQVRAEAAGS